MRSKVVTKMINRGTSKRPTNEAAKFIRSLYANAPRARRAFGRLKDFEYEDIRSAITAVVQRHRVFARHILSEPFPKTYADFRKVRGNIPYGNLDSELRWAVAVLSLFPDELRQFVQLKQRFEHSFLFADYPSARRSLDECEQAFGVSLWLLEQRFLLAEYSSGVEANAALAAASASAANHWLLRYLCAFLSVRADARLSVDDFDTKINRSVGVPSTRRYHSEFAAYVAFKLNWTNLSIERHANYIISAEGPGPIVDRYDTLARMLIYLVCNGNTIPREQIRGHTANLRSIADSSELKALDSFLNDVPGDPITEKDQRFIRILDAYTIGNYAESAELGSELLTEVPDYFPLYEIIGKSLASLGRPWPKGTSPESFSNLVGRRLMDAWAGGGGAENARQDLSRVAVQLPRTNLSYGLSWFCDRQQEWQSEETGLNPAIVVSELLNPRVAWYLSRPGSRINYIKSVAETVGDSSLLRFETQLAKSLEAAEFDDSIPMARRKWHQARALMSDRHWSAAADILSGIDTEQVPPALQPLTEQRLSRAKFDCFFNLARWPECADVVVSTTLRDHANGRVLPTRKLVQVLDRGEATSVVNSIDGPLLYAIVYSKQKEIYPAYDAFMSAVGASKPSELFTLGARFGRGRLLMFLSEVCIPKVLARSAVFESSESVSLERIKLCQFLAKDDPLAADQYLAEINSLTQQSIIRRGVRQVESSKIFVDITGLKQAGRARWRNAFARLEEILQSQTLADMATIDTTEVIIIDLKSGDNKGSDLTEANIESVPLHLVTVSYSHFKQLFVDIRDQFVSSNEFGLNSYLSVRIRHGTIEGQVRSSFEAANLLSQKASRVGAYQTNRYWDERLAKASEVDRMTFQEHLQSFSAVIDGIANRLRSQMIRIRTEGKGDVGLFDYAFSDTELVRLVNQRFGHIRDYDQFLDTILEILWERTHANLATIRTEISGPLKGEAYEALVRLQEHGKHLLPSSVNTEFQTTTSTCLTAFQNDFQRMAEWFNVSGQTTVQQFSLNELIQVCAAVISNTHPAATMELEVSAPDVPAFDGKYFPAFSDIVRTLLDNTITHNGLDGTVQISIVAKISRGMLSFSIANSLSADRRKTDPVAMLQAQHVHFGDDSGDMIAKEGGTGLRKVQKIIRFDLGRSQHQMDFGYQSDDKLAVTLRFDTKGLTL